MWGLRAMAWDAKGRSYRPWGYVEGRNQKSKASNTKSPSGLRLWKLYVSYSLHT